MPDSLQASLNILQQSMPFGKLAVRSMYPLYDTSLQDELVTTRPRRHARSNMRLAYL